MKTKKASYMRDESGQVLIMVTVYLIGLLAMLALVLDGGNIYLQRRRMQNAADAGAIAGARVLALDGTPAQAYAAAQEYTLQRNGADTCDVTITGTLVTVVAHKNVEMTFAQIVGINQVQATARASATYKPAAGVHGLAPIAIMDFAYEFGLTYTIWDDDTEEPPDPTTGDIAGNMRGWLNFDCVWPDSCGDAGADNLSDWMLNGYPGNRPHQAWFRGSGGIKNYPVAITKARLGDILMIPVYDSIEDKYPGKPYYNVIKLAAFRVTAVHSTGNPKGIEGIFEYYVVGAPPSGGDDGGLRTLVLTQ